MPHLPLAGILRDYLLALRLTLGLALVLTLCCEGEMLLGLAFGSGRVHLLSVIVGPICLILSLNILLGRLGWLCGDPGLDRLETLPRTPCHVVVRRMTFRLLYKLDYLLGVVKLAIIAERLAHNKLLLIDVDRVTLLIRATCTSTGTSGSTSIAIAALQVVDELDLIRGQHLVGLTLLFLPITRLRLGTLIARCRVLLLLSLPPGAFSWLRALVPGLDRRALYCFLDFLSITNLLMDGSLHLLGRLRVGLGRCRARLVHFCTGHFLCGLLHPKPILHLLRVLSVYHSLHLHHCLRRLLCLCLSVSR